MLSSPRGNRAGRSNNVAPPWYKLVKHSHVLLVTATILYFLFVPQNSTPSFSFPVDKKNHLPDDDYSVGSASEREDNSIAMDKPAEIAATGSKQTKATTKLPPTRSNPDPRPNPRIQPALIPYLPESNPSIVDKDKYLLDESHPVQVRLLVGRPGTTDVSAPTKFLAEGVTRSRYLRLLSVTFGINKNKVFHANVNDAKPNQPVVWIADFGSLQRDCHSLEMLVQRALVLDKSLSSSLSLLIVDYSGNGEPIHCPLVEQQVGKTNIRTARRNIVRHRHWDRQSDWVQVGEIVPHASTTLWTPYPLREALVDQIPEAAHTKKKLRLGGRPKKVLPYKTKRSTDVAHFWRKGDYSHYSFLRRRVSAIVASLNGRRAGKRKIRSLVRTFGADDLEWMENNAVEKEYVTAMLGAKIIVVAQRDEWEDHYRLMESLASGAMVMTDTMLALPDGLVNGESLVVYDSAESLEALVLHYLDPQNSELRQSIAKRGWEIAMGRHRSWHRVESLIFGQPLTQVDRPKDPPPTPSQKSLDTLKQLTNTEGQPSQ